MLEELVFLVTPLVVQLLLCFMVKNQFIRLLPIVITALSIIGCVVGICITPPSWERLGYVFIAYYSFILLVICGLAWGVWRLIKRRNV